MSEPVVIPIQYEKEKKYFVDVNGTAQKARDELAKENVKSIKLSAKGADINKVSIAAIQLEEEAGKKYKITSMKNEYVLERDDRDNLDKKHLVLNIVVSKN